MAHRRNYWGKMLPQMCGLLHQGLWCLQRMQKTLTFLFLKQTFSNVNNSKQNWREFEVVNSRKWIWYFFPCESTKHSLFYIQLHISRMCNFNICANTKMFQSFRRHACIKDWSRLLFTVFSFDAIRFEKLIQCQVHTLQIINTFQGLVNTQSQAYTSAITVTSTCASKTTRNFC